jgi:L-threonylcarbamoyladenylate synthase
VGLESTILSFTGNIPRLLRPGGLPLEEIETVVGKVKLQEAGKERPDAPGMLPKHYAPHTPVLIDQWSRRLMILKGKKLGFLAFRRPEKVVESGPMEILSEKGDLKEAAANLFAALRRLDALNLDVILAESFPNTGLGRAIMDRLRRASQKERGVDE